MLARLHDSMLKDVTYARNTESRCTYTKHVDIMMLTFRAWATCTLISLNNSLTLILAMLITRNLYVNNFCTLT